MSEYTVTETKGTAPYTYTVVKTYSHRDWVNGNYVYSGLIRVCYDIPAVPAVPAVPSQTIVDEMFGWNASAHSAIQRTGDCYTQFTVPDGVVGVVCGLAPEHLSSDPRDVPHAFYVYQEAGRSFWRVMESGVSVTDPLETLPDSDLFRIERRGGTVSYFFNGKRLHVSAVSSLSPLRVVACLYAAGDGVN